MPNSLLTKVQKRAVQQRKGIFSTNGARVIRTSGTKKKREPQPKSYTLYKN